MPREGTGADGRLAEALEAMRAAGLENVSGQVGDPDPIVATMELWDPMQFDEIVVSTLPTGSSRWLGLDLPHRLEKLTSVPVHHVVSRPPRSEVQWERPPEPEKYGVLSPLAAALTRKHALDRGRLAHRGQSARPARGARSRCPRAARRPSPA